MMKPSKSFVVHAFPFHLACCIQCCLFLMPEWPLSTQFCPNQHATRTMLCSSTLPWGWLPWMAFIMQNIQIYTLRWRSNIAARTEHMYGAHMSIFPYLAIHTFTTAPCPPPMSAATPTPFSTAFHPLVIQEWHSLMPDFIYFNQSPQAKFLWHGWDTGCHRQGWFLFYVVIWTFLLKILLLNSLQKLFVLSLNPRSFSKKHMLRWERTRSTLNFTPSTHCIRKKGFGPEETQVALGVSRDSKDIKD